MKSIHYTNMEMAMRANIQAALDKNPGATFGNVLEGLQEGIKKDLLKNPKNDSALLMQALLNVLQHFYREMISDRSDEG